MNYPALQRKKYLGIAIYIVIFLLIQDTMVKLLLKLCKNENITDISI